MKLTRIYKISIIICLIFILQGCGQNNPEGSIVNETEPTSKITEESTPKITQNTPIPTKSEEGVSELSLSIVQFPILNNGLRITDIAKFLNKSEGDLIQNYKDNIEYARENGYYKEYLYQDYGINIVCCIKDKLDKNYIAKYIELNNEKVSFNGITSNMNFSKVMGVLGEAEIHTLEDGLPGLMTYELRYRYNDINIRIYSWDKNGDGGIYMSIVDSFIPEYRSIRITPEEISKYFSLTRDELEKELGKGEILYDDNDLVSYPKYGVDINYNKNELYSIVFLSNYQINNLKEGIRIEQAMKIMGERPIQQENTENGTNYYIEYKYDNFILKVGYYPEDAWYTDEAWCTNWNIIAKQ